MENNARRDFLKKSLIGIAGASMLPSTLANARPENSSSNATTGLVYRTLGKTGLQLPVISMGCGNTSNLQLVKAAFNAGITLFFSATYYGEGNNEKLLGDALKGIPRDSVLVGTAVMPKGVDHKAGLYTKESTYEAFIKAAEGSLQRFGMDHVDILLLPYAAKRESIFFEPLLKAMGDLKKQGKTRFIGIASHSYCDEAIRAAADTKIYDVVMPAYNFQGEKKKEMKDAIAYVASAGLGIISMKTQAGSYWDKERKQPINSRAALKWVLQNENVSTVVSGMTRFDELQQNIAMMQDLKLSDQELKDLKLAWNEGSPGLYCCQCRECIPQCPHGLDIPTLMRSYMYAYGYKNLAQAQYTLGDANFSKIPCSECSTCVVRCALGFDVRKKSLDIARLRDVPAEFLEA